MQILCSQFIDPGRDHEETFKKYHSLDMQLSFFYRHEFFDFDHDKVLNIIKKNKINIKSVHAPTTEIYSKDFFPILETIKEKYKVKIITIHPQKGDKEEVLKLFNENSEKIKKLEIILAYEIFPKKRKKWINLAGDMYRIFDKDFLKITYDTSHTRTENILEELKSVVDKVEVIHLSSYIGGKEHQPINDECIKIVKYLKSIDFKGFIALEYLGNLKEKQIQDYHMLKKIIGGIK